MTNRGEFRKIIDIARGMGLEVYTDNTRYSFAVKISKNGYRLSSKSILLDKDDELIVKIWSLLHEIGHAINFIAHTPKQRVALLNSYHRLPDKVSKIIMQEEITSWTIGESLYEALFNKSLVENKGYMREKKRCLASYKANMKNTK